MLFRHFEPRSQLSHVTLLIVIPALLSAPISYSVRSSYIAIPLAFAAYWSCLVFVTLTYRLSPFHPLAKYPGPVLAKSSKWWGAYHSATGDQHRCLKRLHDQHGDIVRIGQSRHLPSEISPLTPFQAPTSFPFATLPLSIPSSVRVACAKVLVRAGCRLYWSTCQLVMTRLGWSAWDPFTYCPARPSETPATTQAMESSVFVHSIERVRSYCREAYQTIYWLSGEPRSRIGSQGGSCVGHG